MDLYQNFNKITVIFIDTLILGAVFKKCELCVQFDLITNKLV
jgi:hypothetical protein